VSEPSISSLEIEYVTDAIKSGWISSAGPYLTRFEEEWAKFCGRRYGVAVTNGTAALELAISVLALPLRSEVILPSFTIVSSLDAVLRNGLTPVLVECDPNTYCMDVEDVRAKVTANTTAIMPVHIYGHPVNMQPLLDLAKERDLRIIEDAAEAHGAECLVHDIWKKCGTLGDVSAFSFYANKNITTGEGGMVLTDSAELADRLRSRRNLCFGRKERFLHEGRGWNFRMTNVAAALGCAQIKRAGELIAHKLQLAEAYTRELLGLPLQLPYIESWARTSVWMYAVVLEESVPLDARSFAARLLEKGVETRPFFLGMHEQPVYANWLSDLHFPVTERIARRGLYLPSGQTLTEESLMKVVSAVRSIL
jgi:perosamine synthetase